MPEQAPGEAVRAGLEQALDEYLEHYGQDPAFKVVVEGDDPEDRALAQSVSQTLPDLETLLRRPWVEHLKESMTSHVVSQLVASGHISTNGEDAH